MVERGSDFWIVCHNSSFCFTLFRSVSAREPLSTRESERCELYKTATASCPASDRCTGLRFDWEARYNSKRVVRDIYITTMIYDILILTYWYSWVCIATVCELGGRGIWVWFPAVTIDVSPVHSTQTDSSAYPTSYPMAIGGTFPWDKAAGTWSWPSTSI
jgi:hypothetical protein